MAPGSTGKRRARWPFAVTTVVGFVLFGVWWAFMWLVYALGTCGEDSDFDTQEEYDRLCGPGGSIGSDLFLLGALAAVATIVLGGAAVHRRTWWPVAALAIVLLVAGRATGTLS